jgi:LysM repeat protein
MEFLNRLAFIVFAVWLGVALSGCAPSGQSPSDEENEPHFVLGQSRVNAMDYQGAVEAFKESLDANPRSAAAHYQLAMLFDTKVPDPAAAIYHYQEYLKLDPDAGNADVIRQRIYACKQQLAADVMPLPSAPAMQGQLERLAEQNRQLQDEADTLKKWNAYYAEQLAALSNSISAQPVQNTVQPVQPVPATQQNPVVTHPEIFPAPRTHAVAMGETEAAIARKFGIRLSALRAANPGVNPNKLRVGQILNIPSP